MNASRTLGVVRFDFCLLLVLGFIAMVLILLPFVQPPGKEDEDAPPPGNVVVAIYWGAGNNDVDLWITGPGQNVAVGFSNKSGKLFNLLRDDVGVPDEQRNYENAYSRGAPAGEYLVNVHCWRCPDGAQTVNVEVSIRLDESKSLRPLLNTTVTLDRTGHERTAFRFILNDDGRVEANSVNSVFRPLMAAAGG